ncbi:programmed cell death 1 ligand 1-like [Scleropages formosus]|uniref:programmed cell death 1 ligand 1-like n=1 Tax=Scleropages formosus TaxID=113540 RepID=UPI0008786FB4|nr:programmed cell death 1 ligand 1-like [Scleropages formosus]XP_018601988.1 programmed cell death 1 ligand 1-like [Scleropages formosus]
MLLNVLLFIQFFSCSQAFFTVEISSPSYQAELYGDVALECRFPPGDGTVPLSVFWGRLQPGQNLVVYNMINGQEDLNSQDFSYRGRVNLKKEELSKGRAVLHISHLRMNDSGRYQCLLEMGSVDYKQTTLTVKASYRNITATILQSCSQPAGQVMLECHAEGFPLAQVHWTDAFGVHLPTASINTSHKMSTDGLFVVMSRAILSASCGEAYSCVYVTDQEKTSASLYLSTTKSSSVSKLSGAVVAVVCILSVALCALVLLVVFKKYTLWSPQGTKRKKHVLGSDKSHQSLSGNTEETAKEGDAYEFQGLQSIQSGQASVLMS